ncbi:phosphoenolpyruvate carboxykinase (ATP) [Kurthia sibirica]|uniref:Phosphoenolpyruvate carboxykinase (ATP) n=1 Tax=Kurthia sibirica TaxID=202750 RepID=A0A2U3AJP3_9BACL|nr:phosphoenolpyruvate carboxykinase (ATP) [Kurthia sibirica]PWI24776.1 phosphoenolpyruvate carboxykinase (ATP) [Kurthia sibirica]GEK34876.1 phosphoenolpyruvate carboxykinase [ATP] [Kurthia sibirica]
MNSVEISNELKTLLAGNNVKEQLSVPELVEKATSRGEAILTVDGAVRANTGKYTGRSPKDKYMVVEEASKDKIDWGTTNQPISAEIFDALYSKVVSYLKEKEEIFVFKGFAGADEASRLSISVVNEYAWHNLFAHNLFIRPTDAELANHLADFTIVSAPTFHADPAVDGTSSDTFIIVSLEKKVILIGGTEYAGEMKKSIFGIMNYLLPQNDILSMHCSANVGENGDTALFFGLSGTGKTTLSADASRKLIGDDEHGWSDNGVFNIEGGCYAKTVGLSAEKEPEIYNAIKFGTVLENVVVNEDTRIPDYNDETPTQNTRAAYPIDNIDNIVLPSVAGHPNTIIFLTADAFGVLPPIAKLTKEQAMYHFLSGFTSKTPGTERGVVEPEPAFSTCFGAPFLPLPATVYAEMLGKKIDEHHVNVFLVNTGWTGGSFGTGKRMKLSYTRAMVNAAIEGKLTTIPTEQDTFFGLAIPTAIDNVPSELLNPRNAWADKAAYDAKATKLAGMFHENFQQFANVSADITTKGAPLV